MLLNFQHFYDIVLWVIYCDIFFSSIFLISMKCTFGIVDLLLFMNSEVGEMSVMC